MICGVVDKILVEACVESLEAAMAAARGGAQRIELCANLAAGGTSPDAATLAACLSGLAIPVFVMVRPRPGDFHYSAVEHAGMLYEIQRVKDAGAHGVVTGSLHRDGNVEERRTGELIAAAAPLPVTFHRAFDECPDAAQALERLINLGARRLLTSGGAATAPEGAAKIAELVRLAAGRIGILAGGGVNASNVAELVRISGVRAVHLSTTDAEKIRGVVELVRTW
ncbi:MAG TPA: copper homeostasis protein CutC [Gemmatimonadales bacterium]|nr:copper homeostasis protein CutC [Gemmatimonadales bacterium]